MSLAAQTMTEPSPPSLHKVSQIDGQTNTPMSIYTSWPLHHQPPVSVVVVRETPPRIRSNIPQGTPSQLSSNARIIPMGSSPSISSTFRLQPRGRAIATPSPSSRGRKRNAQCLSMNIATPLSSRNILSPETAQVAPSPVSNIQDVPTWEMTPSSTEAQGDRFISDQIKCSPSRVENALQTLSIKSPRSSRHDDSSNHSASVAGGPGSSFILYTSSPKGFSYLRPRKESNASSGSATIHCSSPSSTKSSPKLAPLTVLKQDCEEVSTPTQRLPIHSSPSSLLISIDTKHGVVASKDVGRDIPVSQIPKSCGSERAAGILPPMNAQTPKRSPDTFISSPQKRFCGSSPSSQLNQPSPIRISPRKRSPRTPLPRVKLTPKSMKRHESMQGAAPSIEQDIRFLSNDFLFESPSRPPLFSGENQSRMTDNQNSRGPGSASQKSNRYQSDLSHKATARMSSPSSPPPRKQSYLPFPEWGPEPTRQKPNDMVLSLASPTIPMSSAKTDTSKSSSIMRKKEDNIPAIEIKSLLTPSKSGSILSDMMHAEERAAAMDADGSLTDPDDDDSFVLQNPASLVEERPCDGRARQRQRLSYNSLDLNIRQSSNSLALTTQASNTSLLGMAFIQQVDSSSSIRKADSSTALTSPLERKKESMRVSESCSKTRDTCQIRSSNTFRRHESEGSLSSIGLALDPTPEFREQGGRDLRTPPAIPTTCSSPPPLSADSENVKATPTKSVCISRSDPYAVNRTIARMAFHADQVESPKMECR